MKLSVNLTDKFKGFIMLNEHDIEDYQSEFAEYQPEVIERKLYEIPRGSIFQLAGETFVPPAHPTVEELGGNVAKFMLSNIDGMYSLCYTLPDKQPVHFAAWTPVFICKKADD